MFKKAVLNAIIIKKRDKFQAIDKIIQSEQQKGWSVVIEKYVAMEAVYRD